MASEITGWSPVGRMPTITIRSPRAAPSGDHVHWRRVTAPAAVFERIG